MNASTLDALLEQRCDKPLREGIALLCAISIDAHYNDLSPADVERNIAKLKEYKEGWRRNEAD